MSQEDPAERLERDAGRMEEESDRVGQRIDDARRDWESKEKDSTVPGAQPDPGEDEKATGNPDAAGSEDPDQEE